MLVHDVVHVVYPGCPTSCRVGRTLVDTRMACLPANEIAALYNHRRYLTDGHEFVVETHDDECPGRASRGGEPLNDHPCMCKGDD